MIIGVELFGVIVSIIQLVDFAKHSTHYFLKKRRKRKEAAKAAEAAADGAVERFADGLDFFTVRLEYWIKYWNIPGPDDEFLPDEYFELCWGNNGARSILKQLERIKETWEDLICVLVKGLTPEERLEWTNNPDLTTGFLQLARVEVSADLPNTKSSTSSFMHKGRDQRAHQKSTLKLLASASHDPTIFFRESTFLCSQLEDLQDSFSRIREDAHEFCSLQNPDLPRYASIASRTASITRTSDILHRALCSRDASAALHRWLSASFDVHEIAIGLHLIFMELETPILPGWTRPEAAIDYQLTVGNPESSQVHSVRGPVGILEKAPSMMPTPHRATIPGQIHLPASTTTLLEFHSKKVVHDVFQPAPAIQGRAFKVENLLVLVQAAKRTTEGFRLFSSVERISLVFQIARFGLILIGTPWLSQIRSASLFRTGLAAALGNTSTWQYALQLESNSPSWYSGSLSEFEPQLFQLGLTFVEVLLAQPVETVGTLDDRRSNDRVMIGLKKGERIHGKDVINVIHDVEHSSFPQLARAVKFCLLQSSTYQKRWTSFSKTEELSQDKCREAFYRKQLREYYEIVYLPIAEIYNAICKQIEV